MFRLNRNEQKTNQNRLIERLFWYFSENLGLFRSVSKPFCLFRLFWYRLELSKQTEIFCFWFHESNRNTSETDLVSVFFGSNPICFCLFRGHPTLNPLHLERGTLGYRYCYKVLVQQAWGSLFSLRRILWIIYTYYSSWLNMFLLSSELDVKIHQITVMFEMCNQQ